MAKPMGVSSLETHLGYWLRYVSNHVSYSFKGKVEAHGVTVAEWVVLRALFDEEGINPSEVAEKIGLTRGAVSKLVDRLVGKRLVSSRAGKGDRRFLVVKLTEKGRELVPILARLADENDREFFGFLGAAEQTTLANVLERIVEHHGLKNVPVD